MTTDTVTYRQLLSSREFVALWISQIISLSGDQLARVAVSTVVFSRTGSAFDTAFVYAITYLPWLVGGPLLGGLADRYPRREMMIGCLAAGAVLVCLMAVPGIPLPLLSVLLFAVILLESPYLSSRAALLLDVLPDDRYVLASSLGQLTIQGTQVLGFALGGALVAVVGAGPTFVVDGASFAVAALTVSVFVQPRTSSDSARSGGGGTWRRIKDGAGVVFSDPWLRGLVLLAWLAAFWVVPEALAAPLGNGNPTVIGFVLAAQPVGAVLGGLVLARFVHPRTRLSLMGPLALVATLPLVAFVFRPATPVVLALLVVSGVGTAYNLPANSAFMQSVPAQRRGQAFGLVSAGLVAGQGIAIAGAGAVADLIHSSYAVIAGAGLVGTCGVIGVRAVLDREVDARTATNLAPGSGSQSG